MLGFVASRAKSCCHFISDSESPGSQLKYRSSRKADLTYQPDSDVRMKSSTVWKQSLRTLATIFKATVRPYLLIWTNYGPRFRKTPNLSVFRPPGRAERRPLLGNDRITLPCNGLCLEVAAGRSRRIVGRSEVGRAPYCNTAVLSPSLLIARVPPRFAI